MSKKKLDKQLYSVEARIPLSHDAADELLVKLLQYWAAILEPKKGRQEHPDDIPVRIKRQQAIDVLLEYMSG